MARLTKAVKSEILQAIIQAANEPQSAKLLKQEYALADLIYKKTIGHDLGNLNRLPASFFNAHDHVSVYIERKALPGKVTTDMKYQTVQRAIGDPYVSNYRDIALNHDASNRSYHNDDYMYFGKGQSRSMPSFMCYGFSLETKELQKAFIAQCKINTAHMESIHALKLKTCQLLDSVTTIDKLIKLWPDVVQYIPKSEIKSNLPAVRVKDVVSLISCTMKASCTMAQKTGKGSVITL
jgi:hypothetical protein